MLPKEAHGVRPGYPPGTLVRVKRSIGVVKEAQTNIDGCGVEWSCNIIPIRRYDQRGKPEAHSHAWRPTYSIAWIKNPDNLHVAWWQAHEWDAATIPDHLRRYMKPWPKIKLKPTEQDCANARTPT